MDFVRYIFKINQNVKNISISNWENSDKGQVFHPQK